MKNAPETPARDLSFGDAVAEVEAILRRLEDGDVDIDELGAAVRRAVELIQVCRQKLARTETEVGDLVAGLGEAATEAESGVATGKPPRGSETGAPERPAEPPTASMDAPDETD